MNNRPELQRLAALVARADAALVAAVTGRGVDGHGEPLPDLETNLHNALRDIETAGRLAAEIRRAEA